MLIRNKHRAYTRSIGETHGKKKAGGARTFHGSLHLGILSVFLLISSCASPPSIKTPQTSQAHKIIQTPTQKGADHAPPLQSGPVHRDKQVGTINGEPIAAREYRWHLERNRGMVVRDMLAQYEIPDPEHFWTTPLDGETPSKRLRDQALDYAIRFKLEQMLAREKGLPTTMSFPELQNQMRRENLQRSERMKQNKPLPGPRHFSDQDFYFYSQGKIHFELIRVLGESDLAVTDDDVLDYYEANKNRLYTRRSSSRFAHEEKFEEIKATVRMDLLEAKYDEWLKELQEKAVIVLDDLALDEQLTSLIPAAASKSRKAPEQDTNAPAYKP